MITVEIAGYAFEGDKYCPECVHTWALDQLWNVMLFRPDGLTAWTTEGLLNALAALLDVDRDDLDRDFPVPFSGQQAWTERLLAIADGDPTPRCATVTCGHEFTED